MDGTRALSRLERTIKHRQMLVFNIGRPFDASRSVNVADDLVGFMVVVAQLEQGGRHSVVHNLDHPSTHQLLVLHQGQIRLYSCSVAVHHEAYRSRWS